ncbi:hypothetical protein RhiirA1_399412, partial [Rhizophagus irregularis]
MSSSPYTFSDSETIDDTNSTISESNTIIQNQRQQISSTRKNRSHTIFFFRVDGDFAYCKICESNFANTNKRAYGYSQKGGNTTNLIAHLRDKHNITKDNYSEYLDEHEEAERLHSAQQQNFQINLSENEYMNPLEVLTDVKTSLIYGSNGEEEDSDVASDDEYIPSDGTRQYWQHSHRQFHHQRRGNTRNRGQSRGRGRRRGGASTSHPVESNLDDINTVEYLQPVNTEGLLQKVCAAIFLSLDELWTVPSNIMLVATFLDPRFKNFDWCNGNGKDEAKQLVQELYNAKKDFLPRNSINSIISSSDDDDDIFKALKVNKERVQDDDEVMLYLQQKQ